MVIKTSSNDAKAKFRLALRNKHVLEKLDSNIDDPNHNYDILKKLLKRDS